jgi:hypothetical protein
MKQRKKSQLKTIWKIKYGKLSNKLKSRENLLKENDKI